MGILVKNTKQKFIIHVFQFFVFVFFCIARLTDLAN